MTELPGMGKRKRNRKRTGQQHDERRKRPRLYQYIMIGGKKKRVRMTPTIDGQSADEFILQNADPIWLVQNEMWELLDER